MFNQTFMLSHNKILIYTLIAAIIIGVVFPLLNYAGKEGFNPSDDGVILAQSWRIVNGEIPHKDFVAMKPALSGYLHTINFFLPLALEDNARLFVIFQNFLISFLWVFLLFRLFPFVDKKGLFIISIAVIAFTLNLNHHGLFPWTTLDGLFWTVIGSYFFYSQHEENKSHVRNSIMAALGIFFVSLAFLSRQSFIFPLLLLDVLALIHFIRLKNRFRLLWIYVFGHLPVFIYLFYLWHNAALNLFFSQMSGRTEFLQVGIIQFIKSFIKSRLFLINLPLLIYIFWTIVSKLSFKNKTSIAVIISKYSFLISSFALAWLMLCLSFSVNMLIISDSMNQANPFELFFIMLSIVLFALVFIPLSLKQKSLLWMAIILSWTVSLSLGSNSPVYCLGIVTSTEIVLSFYILSFLNLAPFTALIKKASPVIFLFSLCVFGIGVWAQQRFNYRDKAADELSCKLGELIPAMGRTQTNSDLCNYYSEFLSIYKSIPAMKDHFVLLPNNAMIYPALKSRNPFPVDWVQHDEYIGQEKFVSDRIRRVLQNEKIFVLIDKFNVETIADGLFPVDYFHYSTVAKNDLFLKTYKVEKYDYLNLVEKYCVEIPSNYRFFRLFVSGTKF